ncbi:MAG: hypothetical protein CMP49_05030 [Flavobacteriales bacterium]|jgi:uncharacterized protein (TIRG00374 family)|nr:hypothetical protein [Flavobacteriales bacterium]|tara:strand:- start:257 stop:1222 length:966 start_codon:yes stop_codon:yes gene_type:complete
MKQLFTYLKPFFFLGFGLLLLFIAFNGINLNDFSIALKTIPFKWVFLSMLFGYLAYVFRGLRWFLLIRPLGFRPKIFDLVNAIAFGYLFNSFIPRSGEIVRCTALNKVSDIPVSKLFGHVLLERLIDFILLAICILASIVLNYKDFMSFASLFSIPKNIGLYVILFIVVIFFSFFIIKNNLKSDQLVKIQLFIQGIKTGFLSIKEIPNKLLFFSYTVLIWICYLLMTIICFYCFTETKDLNLGQGLFILVAGGLGMVVPTPTGIGSYHYLVIQALIALNISREIAQFFAIIVHSSQAVMILVAGFVAMVFLYRKKINKINE